MAAVGPGSMHSGPVEVSETERPCVTRVTVALTAVPWGTGQPLRRCDDAIHHAMVASGRTRQGDLS